MRPYQPGDDVRLIDWNATARMNEPHVRLHVAERALTTWLDVRRLALDGLRHRAAPQGRRRRGRRPGGRPRRQPPRQPPRPAHLRPPRPALRAAAPGPLGLVGVLLQLREVHRARDSSSRRVARRPERGAVADAPARARARARRRRQRPARPSRLGRRTARDRRQARRRRRARSATPPRRPSPTSARSSSSIPRPGRHVRVDTEPQADARGLRRRRRRGARARRRTTSAPPAPITSSSPPATTGCGRSSWASPTGRCCDDIRMATRPARARGRCRSRCSAALPRAPAGRPPATRCASATSTCSPSVAQATRSPWRFVPPALLLAALAALTVGMARPVDLGLGRAQAGHGRARARPLRLDARAGRPPRSHHGLARGCAALRQGPARRLPRRRRHVLRLRRRGSRRRASTAARAETRDRRPPGRRRHGHRRRDQQLARPARRHEHDQGQGAGQGRAILLLSDGSNTQGVDPSEAAVVAKRAGVPVYTIALGTPDGVLDLQALGAGHGHRARPARSGRAARRSHARPAASRSPRSTRGR